MPPVLARVSALALILSLPALRLALPAFLLLLLILLDSILDFPAQPGRGAQRARGEGLGRPRPETCLCGGAAESGGPLRRIIMYLFVNVDLKKYQFDVPIRQRRFGGSQKGGTYSSTSIIRCS